MKNITEDWGKSFMYDLHKIYFLTLKRLDERLKKTHNISFSRFLVILSLHCKENKSQNDIAKFLHLTEATVSRHISGLVDEGYIDKIGNKENRRANILTLTEKGTKVFKSTMKEIDDELKFLFQHIGPEERKIMTKIFETTITHLIKTKS